MGGFDVPLPRKRRFAMITQTVRALFSTPVPRTVPGLRAELLPPMRGAIEILRDALGIPHIYADVESDLCG